MKRTILFITSLVLIVGCSQKPINYEETLNERDGVFYTKDTNQPYSGPVFSLDGKGRNKRESILEDGKMITYKDLEWYENGQKEWEIIWKNGKQHGLFTLWYDNGQIKTEGSFKDGVYDGLLTNWFDTGQKVSEEYYKDGKTEGLETFWYVNGQKYKETTYKNGEVNGLLIYWYDNGQKEYEGTWENGKKISVKEWNEDGSIKN